MYTFLMKSKQKNLSSPLAANQNPFVQIEFILLLLQDKIDSITILHHYFSIFPALSISHVLELEWGILVDHNSHWEVIGEGNKNNL